MLAAMLQPTRGAPRSRGSTSQSQPLEVKRRVGYVPEAAALYETLTAREYLQLVAALHHQPFDEARRRVAELLERLDLSAAMDQRLSEFSKGMKQKVLIVVGADAPPGRPLLDEPLTGLDANAALVVKELIRSLAAQGRTIFFCSHVLEVVERVCSRIVIIDEGRVVADGTAADIAGDGRRRWNRRSWRSPAGATRPRRPRTCCARSGSDGSASSPRSARRRAVVGAHARVPPDGSAPFGRPAPRRSGAQRAGGCPLRRTRS
jgi:ABC-type multidrug transport system ATPase subunit